MTSRHLKIAALLLAAITLAADPIFTVLILSGSTSGTLTLRAAAIAGAGSMITLPAGTTDFSATGGASQVIRQTSHGAPFTVGQLAATDIAGINAGAATALGNAPNSSGGMTTFGTDLPLAGGTLTGELVTVASATAGAGLNLPQGTVPTSPVNGDVWITSGGLFVRVAGVTVGPLGTGGGGGSVSVTAATKDLVVTPSPGTGTFTIGTTTPIISTATSPYVFNGTGTAGTGAQVDNTYLIETAGAAMTLPQAGTTGFAAGVGWMVVPGVSTTITPITSTIAGLVSLLLAPNQFASIGSDGTNYSVALGLPPSCAQNQVIASPNGSTGQPKCRALVTVDIPTGISGGAIPLLNGNNTESGNNSHTGTETFGTVIGGVNTQSGTTYTLQASDCGKTVVATNASAITVTTFQAAVVGCTITVEQGGAGQITFANGGSATLVSAHSYTKTFNAKGATVSLFVDVNGGSAAEFILTGDGA